MKSLKELEFPAANGRLPFNICNTKDLRLAALEWVKAIEEGYNSEKLHIDMNGNKGMITWIKHFFNLEEKP